MKNITMLELPEALKSKGPQDLILDVRTDEEYREGHVPGAKNIPFDEVHQHVEALKKHPQIFVYCRAGRRAMHAFMDMRQAGLSNIVCVNQGGMPDWEDAGNPIEK